MKILMVGNPNVGKSVIFSRLTGHCVIASNYPGTTVEYTRGRIKFGDEIAELIDAPGAYDLLASCKAEEVTNELLADADLILNVVDSTNLERNLFLTLQLLGLKIPMVVVLNIWDEARHQGIKIDADKLSEILGVPTVPTIAYTGEGFDKMFEAMKSAQVADKMYKREDLWPEVGKIASQVQYIYHRHHTILDRLEDLSIHPVTGVIFALIVISVAFFIVRFIGEGIIGYITTPIFEKLYMPIIGPISQLLGGHDSALSKIILGEYFKPEGYNLETSMGLITTGIFVIFGVVLPYIIAFYFVLGILEDIGYLPRLAVMLDNAMHFVGLHGFSVIPMFLGLGCNVPGILATRSLESYSQRFTAITLISIAVPCAALQAMIIGVLGEKGFIYVSIVYGTLFLVWLGIGSMLHRLVPGFRPDLILEIPPYRIPKARVLFWKLWIRIKQFLTEAIPFVLLGVLIANFLVTFHIVSMIGGIFTPVIEWAWGLPKEAISAILLGFLRKDIGVALLAPLNLTTHQLIVACTVLATFFPCVASFAVIMKELGIKGMLKASGIMLLVALIIGTLLNFILPANI